jgi:hypothetical protein
MQEAERQGVNPQIAKLRRIKILLIIVPQTGE